MKRRRKSKEAWPRGARGPGYRPPPELSSAQRAAAEAYRAEIEAVHELRGQRDRLRGMIANARATIDALEGLAEDGLPVAETALALANTVAVIVGRAAVIDAIVHAASHPPEGTSEKSTPGVD